METVMVINDDDAECSAVEHMLEGTYRPMVEKDVRHVIAHLKKRTTLPSLFLLDINLNTANGLEILSELKAIGRFKAIPVIITTRSAGGQVKLAAYELGARDHVEKPIQPEILKRKIAIQIDAFRDRVKLAELNLHLRENRDRLQKDSVSLQQITSGVVHDFT